MSHKPVHLTAGLYSSLQCRHLIRASNVISSWSFLQMPYLILSQSGWWGYRAGDGWEDTGITFTPNPSSSPYFWPSLTPLVKISFSPQLSSAIKVKDDSHFSLTWYWAFNCTNDVCSAGNQKGLQRGMAISCQLYWTSPNKKQLEKLAMLIGAERNKTAERQGSNTYFSTY